MLRRMAFIALFVLGVFAVIRLSAPAAAEDAVAKDTKVLRHVVMYKFKDACTPAQVQEVVNAFSKLPKQVDTIVDFEHGPNVSTENRSEGLTYCFVVTFKDEAGLATYQKSAAHDAYVDVVKDKRERVVVIDYWAPSGK